MPKIVSAAPKIPSRDLSIEGIQKRTRCALEIEKIFTRIQPGKRLANADKYMDRVGLLMKQAIEDRDVLYKPETKVTPQIEANRKAIEQNIQVLQRVLKAAQSANILPKSRPDVAVGLSWEGKLRPGENPLHWAVRNHEHRLALLLRFQQRQSKLIALCGKYIGTIKDPKLSSILKKPDALPKLIQALEVLHILNFKDLKEEAFQGILKDPDIIKIVQNPNFSKFQNDRETLSVLNCADVLNDIDAKGISPLHEAILQKDREMIQVLLFPHLAANPQLNQIFWNRNREIQTRISALRQINSDVLSPTCRAAYKGDLEQLSMATDLDVSDSKGLRPLHYAILGRQTQAIQFLAPRCKLYPKNDKEASFLDYAILSGNAGIYEKFKQLNSPFRLGKEREEFNYLFVSGILDQQLSASANARDPIATEGPGLTNAVWAGAKLFNWIGRPDSKAKSNRIHEMGQGVEGMAFLLNRHVVGLGQILDMLPEQVRPWAMAYHNVWAQANTAYLIASQFFPWVTKGLTQKGMMPDTKKWERSWLHLSTGWNWVSTGYTGLRLTAAVIPVIKKLPAYCDAFKSRPRDVMKRVAIDLFNVGTQAFMIPSFQGLGRKDPIIPGK